MPKISIGIIVYNSEKYIHQCIESCIFQTYQNIEIIIIDDGSFDNTKSVVESLMLQNKQIRYTYQENAGPMLARKKAIENAKGDFFFFLDSDDVLPLNAIEELVKEQITTGSEIVLGKSLYLREDNSLIYEMNYLPFSTVDSKRFLNILRRCGQTNIWGMLIKTSLFQNVIYFPKNVTVGDDLIILIQLLNLNINISKTNSIIYHYYQRNNSIMNVVLDSQKETFRICNLINAMKYLIKASLVSDDCAIDVKLLIVNHIYNSPSKKITHMKIKKIEGLFSILFSKDVIKAIYSVSRNLYIGMCLDFFIANIRYLKKNI